MCLIIFSWQPDAETPLSLAFNRDEYYARPTKDADYWNSAPELFGGMDEVAGGSWLAMNKQGRFAALTYYRTPSESDGKVSRGQLVKDFLTSSLETEVYMQSVQENASQYNGFNLLAGDVHDLYYFSNRGQSVIKLEPGIYGVSNGLLDTPWPKLIKAKTVFASVLNGENTASPGALFRIMQDAEVPADEHLPNTGIPIEDERLRSSIFIASDEYGTRSTCLLFFQRSEVNWYEQCYGANGTFDEKKHAIIPVSKFSDRRQKPVYHQSGM